MIIHFFLVSAFVWSISKCEPPVNSYLPPPNGASGNRPPAQYGPPGGSQNGPRNNGRSGSNQNGNRPQSTYGAPGNGGGSNSGPGFESQSGTQGFVGNEAPRSQYGPPNFGSSTAQSRDPVSSFGNGQNSQLRDRPQSTYGAPNGMQKSNGGFASQPGNRRGNLQSPDTSYGPPASGQPSNSDRQSSQSEYPTAARYQEQSQGSGSNGVPFGDKFGNQSPELGESNAKLRGPPSDSYGAPISGSNDGDEGNEPAQYQFKYDVDDAQSGTRFSHSEQRNGDFASGEYNVLLPDGRKQVVEYEAGRQGYKPQIRYEGGGTGFGGGNDGSQGYPRNNKMNSDSERFSGGEDRLGSQQVGEIRQTNSGDIGPEGFSNDFPSSANTQFREDTGYPKNSPGNDFDNTRANSPGGFSGYPRGGPNQRNLNSGAPRNSPGNNFDNPRSINQGDSNGYPREEPNQDNFNSGAPINIPGNDFDNLGGISPGGSRGYPRGGPNQGNSNRGNSKTNLGNDFDNLGGSTPSGSSGYPRGGPNQGNLNSGSQDQDSEGYPSGRPTSNGGGNFNEQGNGRNGNGFRGMSKNGNGRDFSNNNGYPRGGPEGTRGSGY